MTVLDAKNPVSWKISPLTAAAVITDYRKAVLGTLASW